MRFASRGASGSPRVTRGGAASFEKRPPAVGPVRRVGPYRVPAACLGIFLICLVSAAPLAGAVPAPSPRLLIAPFHGIQYASHGRGTVACGTAGISNITPFAFSRGYGADANLSARIHSCAAAPAGALNYIDYYDGIYVRFHAVGGATGVYANFSVAGMGGISLRAGTCGAGNASNWSCSEFAQSALDTTVFLEDATTGTLYATTNILGGQVGTEQSTSVACTTVKGCGSTTVDNVCTYAAGCVNVPSRSFSPTWSGTTVLSAAFTVPAMNRTHIFEVLVDLSESAWAECQNVNAAQAGCRASAWVGPGPLGYGLDLTSIWIG